jgi:hypothetical protein
MHRSPSPANDTPIPGPADVHNTPIPNPTDVHDTPAQSPEDLQAMKGVVMYVSIRREVLKEPRDVCVMTLENIMSRGAFFESLRDELVLTGDLDAKDVIVLAQVKRFSGPPVAGVKTEFTIAAKSRRNISWEDLLEGLREHFNNTGSSLKMKLEAAVLVKRGQEL